MALFFDGGFPFAQLRVFTLDLLGDVENLQALALCNLFALLSAVCSTNKVLQSMRLILFKQVGVIP